MAKTIRRVPANWEHPCDSAGEYISLKDGTNFRAHAVEWEEGNRRWELGEKLDHRSQTPVWVSCDDREINMLFEEYSGKRPDPADYTPQFMPSEATHFQVYETSTNGTPLSDVMSLKDLIGWVLENNIVAENPRAWINKNTKSFEPVQDPRAEMITKDLFEDCGLSITSFRLAIGTSPDLRRAILLEIAKY